MRGFFNVVIENTIVQVLQSFLREFIFGGVAQLAEHAVHTRSVTGSSPVAAIHEKGRDF